MNLILIWAQDSRGVIDKGPPWLFNIPEHSARLLDLIKDSPVILGLKNWESLGTQFLTNEKIVVLSSEVPVTASSRVQFASSFSEALAIVQSSEPETCFVLGGDTTFAAAMPYASEILITSIQEEWKSETYPSPMLTASTWKLLSQSPLLKSSTGSSYIYNHFKK